jgi:hypothetical protein
MMVVNGRACPLSPVTFDDKETAEAWLQEQLHENPDLLPIDGVGATRNTRS